MTETWKVPLKIFYTIFTTALERDEIEGVPKMPALPPPRYFLSHFLSNSSQNS